MEILVIAGNVGKDAELRRTGNGDAVLGFSLAVDQGKDREGNKRDAVWYDCSIWGKRAEALEQYITKGSKMTLSGRPTVRVHEGKAYRGISVDQLTFHGGGQQGGQQSNSSPDTGGGYRPGPDDEIPFAPEVRG